MDPETHTEDYIHTYWSSGVYPLNARLFNNQKKKINAIYHNHANKGQKWHDHLNKWRK